MNKDAVYPPLEEVTRPILKTAEAAYYPNRSPQTLRLWSCNDNGPIKPIDVGGRLGWSTAEIRKLLRM